VAATVTFVDKGVAGTSLDDLARQVGVTKQTILYHFGSKDGLVAEVLASAARDLAEVLEQATVESLPGWDRVEATVRGSFALAARRPELLGLLRELNRLGSDKAEPVAEVLKPHMEAAIDHLERGMAEGRFRPSDPRLVLVSAYAAVTGVVNDTEVLRAVGLELDVRVAANLRRTVLDFLKAALVPS